MRKDLHPNATYMFQHLHKAITILVIGSEDIRKRLVPAGEHFTSISIEAAPKELQPLAQEIMDYLTEYEAPPAAGFPGDSDIRVTMKRRRKSTAVRIAQKMWSLYFQYLDAIEQK